MHKLDILTKLNILKANVLELEKMICEEYAEETNQPQWSPTQGFSYPQARLKGDGTDNPAEELHYNNVEYIDYKTFLEGWIKFYKAIGNSITQPDIERLHAYEEELMRIQFEGE